LQDGFIQIPSLADWLDEEVSIVILRKPKSRKKVQNSNKNNSESDCKKLLTEFHKVRKMRSGKAEVLTLEKAINYKLI
jgi:hypothetical protein